MMVPNRVNALAARMLAGRGPLPDCGNPVAAQPAAARRDVFARRRLPALRAHALVPAHVP
jgi:hypothetical protein